MLKFYFVQDNDVPGSIRLFNAQNDEAAIRQFVSLLEDDHNTIRYPQSLVLKAYDGLYLYDNEEIEFCIDKESYICHASTDSSTCYSISPNIIFTYSDYIKRVEKEMSSYPKAKKGE